MLIQLDTAGIGVWDPYVREGEVPTGQREFPRVIGNDGAGTVVAAGERVTRFRIGERVYAYSMDGGFYAEYVAVHEDNVAPIPPGVDPEEAGALGADGVTALRGLEDQLQLEAGETLMIYGASGGIGHIAVQLAKRMGVEGPGDRVRSRRRRAGPAAGRRRRDRRAHDDAAEAARAFAPDGLDAALVLTYGEGLPEALRAVKQGGRVAYPNGVDPEPRVPDGIESHAYDGDARPGRVRPAEPPDRDGSISRRARPRLPPRGRRDRAP